MIAPFLARYRRPGMSDGQAARYHALHVWPSLFSARSCPELDALVDLGLARRQQLPSGGFSYRRVA